MLINKFWNSFNSSKNFYRRCFESTCNKHGISTLELDIIMFLYNCKEDNTASDIVKIRGLTKSNVSSAIKKLTDQGYIEGYYEGDNRRSVHLSLTAKVNPIIEDALVAREYFCKVMFDGFSEEEMRVMLINFERISENINKENQV